MKMSEQCDYWYDTDDEYDDDNHDDDDVNHDDDDENENDDDENDDYDDDNDDDGDYISCHNSSLIILFYVQWIMIGPVISYLQVLVKIYC